MLAELIPQAFFQSRMDIWLWLMAIGAIVLLVFGADRAVTAAVRMAKACGMSTIIIGATVVSLGTTAPEAFVSVTAAFNGNPGLALGNGVGSIICDTAMIFGICCCITSLPKDRFILNRHGWLQFGAGALLVVVIAVTTWFNGGIEGVRISRGVGIVFLLLLVGYMWVSIRWARSHQEAIPSAAKGAGKTDGPQVALILRSLMVLAVGLVMVIGGAQIMVGSVGELCGRYGVPPDVLAVTLVAFGTSLPELATAIASIVKGHPELLVGNIIGADILNVLFVIGASATAVPLEVPPAFFYLHLPVMMVTLVLFRLFVFGRGGRFRRWEGIPLLAVFGGYYAVLLILVITGVLEYSPL